jgi:hypothetical protein
VEFVSDDAQLASEALAPQSLRGAMGRKPGADDHDPPH